MLRPDWNLAKKKQGGQLGQYCDHSSKNWWWLGDQSSSWGCGEKYLDPGCILKVEWIWSVRERSREKTVLSSVETERVTNQREILTLLFNMPNDVLIRHSSKTIKQVDKRLSWIKVLVLLGYYNTKSQTGLFINNRNLFLQFWNLKVQDPGGQHSQMRVLFQVTVFLSYRAWWKGWGSSQGSLFF